MFAYREYLVNGHCPFCRRDLSIVIKDLDTKVIHKCVDCASSLKIVPNKLMFADIFDQNDRMSLADTIPIGKDCCGV